MQSLFFATQAITVLYWSRLSDTIGRKPVILLGLFGLSLSMYSFGLSRTFWGLVIRLVFPTLLSCIYVVKQKPMSQRSLEWQHRRVEVCHYRDNRFDQSDGRLCLYADCMGTCPCSVLIVRSLICIHSRRGASSVRSSEACSHGPRSAFQIFLTAICFLRSILISCRAPYLLHLHF